MIKKDSLKTRIKNWEPCAIANRIFNITLSTLILVISVSYLIEAIKGNSSMITAIIATALGMTTIIISWVMYSKNNKSTIIKHIGSIGFLVINYSNKNSNTTYNSRCNFFFNNILCKC